MKIVVTGGAGFIGSHLVDALISQDHQVTVIDNFSSGQDKNLRAAIELSTQKNLNLQIVRDSICKQETWLNLPKHDALFHFAAQTSVTASVSDPDHDFQVNVQSVRYITEWIRRHKIRFVLYANTAGALYGNTSIYPTDEFQPTQPESPYGATKMFFESYYRALAKSLVSSNVWSSDPLKENYNSWVSLRLGNVYGPRQITKGEAGVIPIFIETLGKGEAPNIFGDGNKTRDYVHVSDVVNAFLFAFKSIQKNAVNDFFNVGTGVEVTDFEVFQGILRSMHDLAVGSKTNKFLINSLRVKQPQFLSIRPGEVTRSLLSISKIKQILGWSPSISFSEGVRSTVEAFCVHNNHSPY